MPKAVILTETPRSNLQRRAQLLLDVIDDDDETPAAALGRELADQVLQLVGEGAAALGSTAHRWQYSRFAGTRTCERCGLLPLDDDDYATDCEGRT